MNILEEIKKELVKKGAKGNISKETSFKDMEIDSLDLMDLVVSLEAKLEISISDDDLLSLKTVNDVVLIIEKLKNEK
ncbi:acyl carrier protein [Spiroplasma turonicum]|uniref:Putative acyl carrier protein n=1 Tax=Spiroplasma turonicum TaxID=216946 RepID=A0A0K1P529_9MOLU|nr:phosphopantetheine-binding protein [Spiroplasma turonicum]AKU79388.1 putative acyl carrier protein [Spiroplasma turonicum]ALX70409.1 putative acyl carrier protein [Spiroplasma turonicum]